MKVILISGKAESGKSETVKIAMEICQNFEDRPVCLKMAYGDYVKDTAKLIFGWNGKKDEVGRELLQHWGTDFVRAKHPDFWAETVIRLAEVIKNNIDFIFIDDARFPNEIELWKQRGFDIVTVRVERPGHENILTDFQKQHYSETALDDYIFDITSVAQSKEELYEQINTKLIPILKGENKW